MKRQYKYRHWMTDHQQAAMSKAGVMAREIIRQSHVEPRFSVIPSGLQLALIAVDLRYEQERFYHSLLFHTSYHNRYKMVLNNNEYPTLIGWDAAARITADCIVPIRKDLTQ